MNNWPTASNASSSAPPTSRYSPSTATGWKSTKPDLGQELLHWCQALLRQDVPRVAERFGTVEVGLQRGLPGQYGAVMAIDPMLPYGEVRETTLRIATWNTWSQFGPWQEREPVLFGELARIEPDIVCLQEAWKVDNDSQADRLGAHLEMHAVHVGDSIYEGVISGHAIVSRWPIGETRHLAIEGTNGGDGAGAAFARIDGPRGPIDVVSLILDWRMDLSHVRSAQLAEICQWARELGDRFHPLVMCGDFNSPPDSDELRAMVGHAPVHAPNMVFYDAVAMAAVGDTATYSARNPFAAIGMYPERQLDHIFSHWPKPHGLGHPVSAAIIGDEPVDGLFASDHFGVRADLRY